MVNKKNNKNNIEELDDEQLDETIEKLSDQILTIFNKAKKEANKILAPYGAQVDVNVAVRLKDEHSVKEG